VEQNWISETGSITKEPGWQKWCCKENKETDIESQALKNNSPEEVVDGGNMEG